MTPMRSWARFAIWVLLLSILGLPLAERSAAIVRLTAAARTSVSGLSIGTAYTQAFSPVDTPANAPVDTPADTPARAPIHTGAIRAPRPPAEAKATAEPTPSESRLNTAGGEASCPFGTAETSSRIRLVLAGRSSQIIPAAVRLTRRWDVPRTWLPGNRVFLHTVQNHSSYL
jgi:hypothetical protein